MKKYDGIAGLEGREPVGACVTIGIKDKQRGFPTETDRFHIVNAKEEKGVRHPHPAFQSFNSAPADKRKILRGNIVHAKQSECFEFHLKAQVLKKPAHPNKLPACVSDGITATRWTGPGPDDFSDIKCPHDLCEYRKTTPPVCKPWMRFLFRIRWEGQSILPTPLVKFTSGSWYSVSNFKGFFDYLANTARELGLKEYTLFGLPFIMTLQYQTKPSVKSRFPVISISPESDPIEFFMAQRAKIKELTGDMPLAITDSSEQATETVFADFKSVSVPSEIPAETIPAEVTDVVDIDDVEPPLTLEDRLIQSNNIEQLGTIWEEVNDARDAKVITADDYKELKKIKNTKKKQFNSGA